MDAKQFLAEFGHIANAPEGVQRVREMILSLAVSGDLLIAENPEDATPLLQSINAKKAAHTDQNKVVPQQAKIFRSEVRTPSHWAVCRLGDLVLTITGGGTPSKGNSAYWNGDIPWASVKDLSKANKYLTATEEKITEEGLINSSSNLISPGRVIVSTRMGLGKLAINMMPVAINQDLKALELSEEVNIDYFYVLYQTRNIVGKGTTVSGIRQDQLLALPAALPPTTEQARIVAKVDELMVLCDKLEAQQIARPSLCAQTRQAVYEAFKKSESVSDFRNNWVRLIDHSSLVLDSPSAVEELRRVVRFLAVRGLLTLQDEDDGSAKELLSDIRLENDRLVAEKKMKRRKQLPSIANAQKPFDLPKGWAWARFPELGEFARGKSKHRPRNDPKLFNPGIHPLIQTGEVARAKRVITKYHSKYSELGLAQSRLWPKGTLCITIAANIANAAILGFDACFPDSVVGFIPASAIAGNIDYFLTFMETARAQLLEFAPSTAQKNINLEILESVLIPIPPLNEMNRIMKKLNEIMVICDKLEYQLIAEKNLGTLLAASAVSSITGIRTQKEEELKIPKTELISKLRIGESPSIKEQPPLTAILARQNGEMSAKDLWQRFGGEIDDFYAQLKLEVNNGWIREPEVAEMREVAQ